MFFNQSLILDPEEPAEPISFRLYIRQEGIVLNSGFPRVRVVVQSIQSPLSR